MNPRGLRSVARSARETHDSRFKGVQSICNTSSHRPLAEHEDRGAHYTLDTVFSRAELSVRNPAAFALGVHVFRKRPHRGQDSEHARFSRCVSNHVSRVVKPDIRREMIYEPVVANTRDAYGREIWQSTKQISNFICKAAADHDELDEFGSDPSRAQVLPKGYSSIPWKRTRQLYMPSRRHQRYAIDVRHHRSRPTSAHDHFATIEQRKSGRIRRNHEIISTG